MVVRRYSEDEKLCRVSNRIVVMRIRVIKMKMNVPNPGERRMRRMKCPAMIIRVWRTLWFQLEENPMRRRDINAEAVNSV